MESTYNLEPSSLAVSRFKILIADDDAANRETLAGMLQDRGFDAVTASDGKEAVQVFQANTVHLALFDMHMPRLTGLQALRLVRQMNQLLPAILMTANSSRQLIEEATQAQVFTVIPKPVNKTTILTSLTQALQLAYPNHPPLSGERLR
ncbi:response regulator [soil metagenome]